MTKIDFFSSYLLYLLIFVMSTLISCDEVTSESARYEIEKTDYANWKQLLHIVEITPLQADTNCLMSYAEKCFFTKDKIFFHDYKAKQVYVFSSDGKFLHTIGKKGHAMSEYTSINDTWLQEDKSEFIIMDGRGQLYYDMNDGDFIKREKNNSNDNVYCRFSVQSDGSILYIPDVDGKSSVVSHKGNEKFAQTKRSSIYR